MRQVPLPGPQVEGWPILSGDGEHVLFFRDAEGGKSTECLDLRHQRGQCPEAG